MFTVFFRKPLTHIILIAALGLIVYSNTFNVPFQWDDKVNISDNPIVKDMNYFVHPSEAKWFGKLYYSFRDRYMGYLTFALNYELHGLAVKGYHVVNITLHILNALLVYALLRLTLRTPFFTPTHSPSPPAPLPVGEGGRRPGEGVPLFVGLLFVSHPIQTEAVTYIMGRLPLLMWLFYLSSLVLYVKWRLTSLTLNPSPSGRGQGVRGILYLLSIFAAILAMKTKENAFTLPFAIALYEFMFFGGFIEIASPRARNDDIAETVIARKHNELVEGATKQSRPLRGRLLYLAPFALTLLIIPLSLLSFDNPIDEVIGQMESASRHYTEIPRASYLFTQFRVLVTYLRLLFLPVNQNFDYDYPVYSSFFNPQVFLSFLFLSSIFALGVYFFIRSKKNPVLRLFSWGIFWFFLTLSVESSIFPIPIIISEYRLYAPSMGVILFIITASLFFIPRRFIIPALITVVVVLSGAAYARNAVWKSDISLWEDVVRKSPKNSRGHNNLGNAYKAVGLIDKAEEHYEAAVRLNPYNAEAHNNLGIVHSAKGLFDKAIAQYQIGIKLNPDNAAAHFGLGLIYLDKGHEDKARREFEATLQINRNYQKARGWLNYLDNKKKQ